MATLTIDEIVYRVFYNKLLPKALEIVGDDIINTAKLVDLLADFNSSEEMIHFLHALAKSKTVKLAHQGEHPASAAMLVVQLFHSDISLVLFTKHQKRAFFKFAKEYTDSAQLLTIFQYLLPQTIYDLYLKDHTIPAATLIALFNDEKNLKLFSIKLQKMIYRYLSRFHSADETPYIEMKYFAARFGHTLGLRGTFTANKVNISLENGEFQHFSFTILTEQLEKYVNASKAHPAYTKVLQSFQFTQQLLQQHEHSFSKSAASLFYDRYVRNKLIAFPAGIPEHSFAIALYGGFLVYCNRGKGSQRKYNCAIFPLKHKLTPHHIQKLMTGFESIEAFNNFLSNFIDLDRPLYTFHNKSQKYQTCTYANPKAIIGPLSVLVSVSPNCSGDFLLKCLRSMPHRSQYKHFTHTLKTGEIHLLIQRMKQASHPILIQFYAYVVKQVITLHPGKGSHQIKAARELKRARLLLANVPEHIMDQLILDSSFVNYLQKEKLSDVVIPPPGFTGVPVVYLKQYEHYTVRPANMDMLIASTNRLSIKI